MSEARSSQVNTDDLDCLSLRFVDCEGKRRLDGILQTLEVKGQHRICWYERDSRQQCNLSFVWTAQNIGLNDATMEPADDTSRSVSGFGRLQ